MNFRRAQGVLIAASALALIVAQPSTSSAVAPAVVGGGAPPAGLAEAVVRIYSTDPETNETSLCTGVLISNRWVLSAGHCVEGPAEVWGGSSEESTLQFLGEATAYRHPDYLEEVPSSYHLRNDVSLFRLASPTNVVTRFATLATTNEAWSFAAGAQVTAVGWGLTSAIATEPPTTLQSGTFTLLGDLQCQQRDQAANEMFDAASSLCAEAPSTFLCMGDSGGPWFATQGSTTVVVGVTSYGVGECDGHGVAAWVPGALTWIRAVTGLPLSGPAATGASTDTARIFGMDRYESAAATSGYWPNTVNTVYVATGANFPDSLAAGATAARSDSPLLLVNTTSVPLATEVQLRRLRPSRIVVAGGSVAVSEQVLSQLRLITGVTPTRSWGANRYDTAEALTRLAWPSGSAPTVWVASGQTYQDALIASAAAAVNDQPFVLVNGGGALSSGQSNLLSALAPTSIKVVAAPGAVSAAVLQQLGAIAPVTMFDAADVSARSASVWAGRSTPGPVVLATSLNFPDALSAVPFSAHGTKSPLFLVPGTCVPTAIRSEILRLSSGRVRIMGGPSAVGLGVENLTTCT